MTKQQRNDARIVIEEPFRISDGGVSKWFRATLRDALDEIDRMEQQIQALQTTIEVLQLRKAKQNDN